MKHKNIIFMGIVFLVSIGINFCLSNFSGWGYFGTIISAFFGGPLISVPVGLVSQIIDTGVGNTGRWILLTGHFLVGLLAGLMVMKGFAKKSWKPFIIYIVVLVIVTLTYYARTTLWLMEAQGIWNISDLMYYFLQNPKEYFMDVIKLGWGYTVPLFVSVYIAWIIPKVVSTKYDFRYKNKY